MSFEVSLDRELAGFGVPVGEHRISDIARGVFHMRRPIAHHALPVLWTSWFQRALVGCRFVYVPTRLPLPA